MNVTTETSPDVGHSTIALFSNLYYHQVLAMGYMCCSINTSLAMYIYTERALTPVQCWYPEDASPPYCPSMMIIRFRNRWTPDCRPQAGRTWYVMLALIEEN